jgi:hypothetical protein
MCGPRRIGLIVLLAGFVIGCSEKEPPPKDRDAAFKSELKKLNEARQKEWGNKN